MILVSTKNTIILFYLIVFDIDYYKFFLPKLAYPNMIRVIQFAKKNSNCPFAFTGIYVKLNHFIQAKRLQINYVTVHKGYEVMAEKCFSFPMFV